MTEAAETIVVDASVAVKWFLADGESGVAEAAALLSEHAGGRIALVAPTLIVHELTGVLTRRLPPEARVEALNAFFDADVELVAPSRELAIATVRLVADRQTSAFDAAYAALATSLSSPLATADRRLATALEGAVTIRAV